MKDSRSGKSISGKLVQGGAWMYGRMLTINLMNVVVMAILARQLSLAEFGLVALANVLLKFLMILGTQGINQFVIYDNSETRESYLNAAFWLDLTLSVVSALIGLAFIPLISNFYEQPELKWVVMVLLLKIPFDALSRVPDALFSKNLDFKTLEIRDTLLQFLSGLASVIMAFTGFGLWSLVIPSVLSSPLKALVVFSVSDWRPRWTPDFKHWKRIFNYSSHVIGSTFTTFIISEGDTLLVGKVLGPSLLGVYNLAWQSSNFVTRTIVTLSNKLTLPAMAAVAQEKEKMKEAFSRILRLLSTISFPLLIGLFVVADDFILTVYGDKWSGAVLPLRIMIIYALRYAVGSPVGSIFKAMGRPDLNFKLGLIVVPFYLIAIWVGGSFGIVGVAIGVTFVRTVFGLISFQMVASLLETSFRRIVEPMLPALFASLSMGAILFLSKWSLEASFTLHEAYRLVVLIVLGAGTYLVLIRLGFTSLSLELIKTLKPLLKGKIHFAERVLLKKSLRQAV